MKMTFLLQQVIISLILVALLGVYIGISYYVVQLAAERLARGNVCNACAGFVLVAAIYLSISLLFCCFLRLFAVFAFADIAGLLDGLLLHQPLARAKIIKHLKSIVCPVSKTVP